MIPRRWDWVAGAFGLSGAMLVWVGWRLSETKCGDETCTEEH